MALADTEKDSGFRTYAVAKGTGHCGEQVFFNLEINDVGPHQNKSRLCSVLRRI
jgi:hypothetical protein